MMTDNQKLKAIAKLVTAEQKEIREANDDDSEYTSLGGNGVNGFEAYLAFEPIAKEIMRIINAK